MEISRRAYLKSQVCRWDFLPLELTDEDLIHCAYLLFEHVLNHPELEALRVPEDDLYQFLFDIYNSYHSKNPYHNFRHAVDVLQATYYFLCRIGATTPIDSDPTLSYQQPVHTLLRPLNVFALLLASIGHDVGHPGVNNMFMVNTATPLAILYNDRSVLESFHSMAFYHILQQHCFSQITDIRNHPEYASFRSIIVSSILATDMSLHDEYVQKIRDQAERIRTNEFNPNDEVQCERERLILCGALIKCADISNCARPFSSAKRWAQYLAEEFFQQGDLEKELGLSVMPMNERGKLRLEDFQLSFKRHIALKLFQAVSDVTKEMSFTLDYINENINYWEIMKNDSGLGGEMEPLEKSNPYRADAKETSEPDPASRISINSRDQEHLDSRPSSQLNASYFLAASYHHSQSMEDKSELHRSSKLRHRERHHHRYQRRGWNDKIATACQCIVQ
ncbi:3',5'-cyclic-nucleotide phosphodiesterase [Apophysomyces ossiformis]|uniref:Phosphodiesterase n=1 Tax=Apophysomyces ossiformis TaxID=679940 RepID=A0A8H7BWD4_9FUNG|nr:3',5'-cyclic-nucleotide phosphodiesterase [Apophysomyces ossiformis]